MLDAKQKQKEADVAIRHAAKQGAYNANTNHFNKRFHRADAKQKDANKAAERAQSL